MKRFLENIISRIFQNSYLLHSIVVIAYNTRGDMAQWGDGDSNSDGLYSDNTYDAGSRNFCFFTCIASQNFHVYCFTEFKDTHILLIF